MENQLKPPTQPRKVSEDDAIRISAFKSLILENGADYVKKTFMNIYFDYSQLLTKDATNVRVDTSSELYILQCLIEVLE